MITYANDDASHSATSIRTRTPQSWPPQFQVPLCKNLELSREGRNTDFNPSSKRRKFVADGVFYAELNELVGNIV